MAARYDKGMSHDASGLDIHPKQIEATSPRTPRLIVLVASTDADAAVAGSSILQLADRADIDLIGVYRHRSDEPALRRLLVTISAMISEPAASVLIRTVHLGECSRLVRANWQPQDTLLCIAEQPAPRFGKAWQRLLGNDMPGPLLFVRTPEPHRVRNTGWIEQAALWLGAFAIILGFFLVQVRIAQIFFGPGATASWILSVLAEGWLLLRWNSRFER